MTLHRGVTWMVGLALMAAGCANTSGKTGSTGAASAPTAAAAPTAGSVAASLTLQPLTAASPNKSAASSLTTAPATVVSTKVDGNLSIHNLTVGGDPTRIVYPTPTLTAGRLYPVLVFAHGHGMDQTQMTDRTDLADAAAKEGWISAAGDFGGRAAWANDGALKDVGALVAEVVAHHQGDPQRIYLSGFSMGGGTALLAAENPLGLNYKAAAVVSTQGFTDLHAMTLPAAGGGQYAQDIGEAYGGLLTAALAKAHSPVDDAAALKGIPVYLEHGEADTNVPPSHTLNMAAALKAVGNVPEVHTYPGLTHSEATIHTQAIMEFLRGKSSS